RIVRIGMHRAQQHAQRPAAVIANRYAVRLAPPDATLGGDLIAPVGFEDVLLARLKPDAYRLPATGRLDRHALSARGQRLAGGELDGAARQVVTVVEIENEALPLFVQIGPILRESHFQAVV